MNIEASRFSIKLASTVNRREEKNECDTDQIYGFLPRRFAASSRNQTIPCAQRQHYRHADCQNTRRFQRRQTASHSTVLQLRIVTLSMWRESDGFRQRQENAGNKRCDTNNRQAAHRCHLASFSGCCPGSNNEKKNSTINGRLPANTPAQRRG